MKIAGVAATLTCTILTGCGTAFVLPQITEKDTEFASRAALQDPARGVPKGMSEANFRRTVQRVAPVAKQFCIDHITRKATCDMRITLDMTDANPNAFQYYQGNGQPVIQVNGGLLRRMRSEDQLAFVLGHETGHHIAAHIDKSQQQAAAGAIILGSLMAAAAAQNPYASQQQIQHSVDSGVVAGAAIGSLSYSKTYELEADVIATYIAESAGYDAEEGATFFAQDAAASNMDGTKSFWGTHPADEKRMAMVSAAMRQRGSGGLQVRPNPNRQAPVD